MYLYVCVCVCVCVRIMGDDKFEVSCIILFGVFVGIYCRVFVLGNQSSYVGYEVFKS